MMILLVAPARPRTWWPKALVLRSGDLEAQAEAYFVGCRANRRSERCRPVQNDLNLLNGRWLTVRDPGAAPARSKGAISE
jgi:hypothetical protein